MMLPNIYRLYPPILTYFRAKRLNKFYKTFTISSSTRILDVGGGHHFFWRLAASKGFPIPAKITILNTCSSEKDLPANFEWIQADAREIPFSRGEFDIVFSNSVIEHLGDLQEQAKMAAEIRRVGRQYWVQTPDPRFPIEPHYLTPFVHWMPRNMRGRVARRMTIWGILQKPTKQQIEARLDEIRLISKQELRNLFPDGQILSEKFVGLPKSLIAFKL